MDKVRNKSPLFVPLTWGIALNALAGLCFSYAIAPPELVPNVLVRLFPLGGHPAIILIGTLSIALSIALMIVGYRGSRWLTDTIRAKVPSPILRRPLLVGLAVLYLMVSLAINSLTRSLTTRPISPPSVADVSPIPSLEAFSSKALKRYPDATREQIVEVYAMEYGGRAAGNAGLPDTTIVTIAPIAMQPEWLSEAVLNRLASARAEQDVAVIRGEYMKAGSDPLSIAAHSSSGAIVVDGQRLGVLHTEITSAAPPSQTVLRQVMRVLGFVGNDGRAITCVRNGAIPIDISSGICGSAVGNLFSIRAQE